MVLPSLHWLGVAILRAWSVFRQCPPTAFWCAFYRHDLAFAEIRGFPKDAMFTVGIGNLSLRLFPSVVGLRSAAPNLTQWGGERAVRLDLLPVPLTASFDTDPTYLKLAHKL
jgi:hypothetical protein